MASSSVPWIVSNVHPYPSGPAIPVAPFLSVSSSFIPFFTSLSDFPLLGSSRMVECFPLFHILCSSSRLSLGQLNLFPLRHSVAHVLGIPFLDISKLLDRAPLLL